MSKHPLRFIGQGEDGAFSLSEEERESHLHIMGSPGEGKSKFLEMMICRDIKRLLDGTSKSGVCFLDSSDGGKTVRRVLKYCCKVGFNKILIVEPRDHDKAEFGYIPLLNPIVYNAPAEVMAAHVLETMHVLWQTKDASDESIISKYAPAVIEAIHAGHGTIPDIQAFTVKQFGVQRERFLSAERLDTVARITLREVYKDASSWREFQSTARRFEPFFHSVLKMMLASEKAIDFQKLIADGWVILANLYPKGIMGRQQQRLLGTLILNQLDLAMTRLIEHNENYNVPYYLYIDEFGQYATQKIADILFYSRQSGFRLNLAHQSFSQIENAQVSSAVKLAANIKVLFHTSSPEDRATMLKMMFAGPLDQEVLEYVFSQTKKQHAFVKVRKAAPKEIRVADWPDPNISKTDLDAFKLKIYKSNPELYSHRSSIWEEIKQRSARTETFKSAGVQDDGASKRPNLTAFRRGKSDDNKPARKTPSVRKGGKEAVGSKDGGAEAFTRTKRILVSRDVPNNTGYTKPPARKRPSKDVEGDKQK